MLYDDFEKRLMADAVQENMRTKLVATKPFQAIVDDFLGSERLTGKRVLDIGPGQCDFLDIAASQGAHTFGVDFDPCVARLGWQRGHSVLTCNLQQGFPEVARPFDGIFCRASFNLYWFQQKAEALRGFLGGIARALHANSWLWIVPWNNPADGHLSPEVETIVRDWAAELGVRISTPSAEQISRYGIGYQIPEVRIWTRRTKLDAVTRDASVVKEPPHSSSAAPRTSTPAAAPTTTAPVLAPRDRARDLPQPLPIEYLIDLFRLFKRYDVSLLTPDDLDFSRLDPTNEAAYRASLAGEYKQWVARRAQRGSPAVMLFHDCDAGPGETVELCGLEAELGVRSTVALFARHRPTPTSEAQPYPLDFARFRQYAERARHCVTYHCNAWEVAGYDFDRLPSVFREDLDTLGALGFDLTCMSAHGGRPGPDGRNNSSFFYPAMTERKLVWTHNGYGLSGSRFSDGNFTARWAKPDPGLDLRTFLISSWTEKQRLLLLLHPQYYFARSRTLVERSAVNVPWLNEYWDLFDAGKSAEYWKPLERVLEAAATA